MITCLLGRSKETLSRELVRRMDVLRKEEKDIYLLVPEQDTLASEGEVLKTLEVLNGFKEKGLMDIQVVSFRKFATLLFARTRGRNKILLAESGKKMILKKVLLSIKDELKEFRSASYRDGVLEALLTTIEELRENNREGEGINTLEGNLKIKIEELYFIKEAYEDYLGELYLDDIGFYDLMEEGILENEFDAHFFIDDFFILSPQQIKVVKALGKMSQGVTIALPYHGDHVEDFPFTQNIYEDLKDGGDVEKILIEEMEEKRDELMYLEERFLRHEKGAYSGKVENISIREYGTMDLEVRELFKEITHLIRDEGYRFSDIEILCNSLDEYRNLFLLYSPIYNIPVFFNETIPVQNHAFIQTVLSFFRNLKTYRTKDILYLLKGGYLNVKEEDVEQLELYINERGIDHFKWSYSFSDETSETVRLYITDLIGEFRNTLKGKMPFKEMTEKLVIFIEKIGLNEKVESLLEEERENLHYRDYYIDTGVWNSFMEILDQMGTFLGENNGDGEEYLSLLEGSLASETIKILPTGADEVLILGSQEMYKESAKVLFILGAGEGIFPRGVESNSLFPLGEMDLLEEGGILRKGNSYQEVKNELDGYFSITTPDEKLYISYSANNRSGEKTFRSSFITQLLRLFPALKKKTLLGEDYTGYFYSEKKAFLDYMTYLGEGKIIEPYEAYFHKEEKFAPVLEGRTLYEERSETEGDVGENLASLLFFTGDQGMFSVSKLESYGTCPYAFFLKYGLRLMEKKKHQLGNMDIGNIYHHVFEEVFKRKGLEFKDLSEADIALLGKDAFKNYYQGSGFETIFDTNYYKHRLNLFADEGIKRLYSFKDYLSRDAFSGAYYELPFGKGDTPLLINEKKVLFEGKVDRIDTLSLGDDTFFKITDYKLSGKSLDYKRFYDGLSLQLFFYLNRVMAKQGIFEGKSQPAGLFYFSFDEGKENILYKDKNKMNKVSILKMEGEVLRDEEILKHMNTDYLPVSINKDGSYSKSSHLVESEDFIYLSRHAEEVSKGYVEKISEGKFKATPYFYAHEDSGCTWCPYGHICREKKYRVLEKKGKSKEEILRKLKGDNDGVDEGTTRDHH